MPLPLVTTVIALATGLAPAPSGPAPAGPWHWPLTGVPVVSRPFQPPVTRFGAGHRGVDLSAAPHAPVLAAGAGVVSFAGYVAGVGVVTVTHRGGLRTTYEPVLPSVHQGLFVAAGSVLGTVQPGHGSCGPGRWCLHWGLLRGRTYLDPLSLVRRGPVRLLPMAASDAPGVVPAMGAVGPEFAAASAAGRDRDQADDRPFTPSAGPADGRGTRSSGRRVRTMATAAAAAAGVGLLGWSRVPRRMAAPRGRHRRWSVHSARRGRRTPAVSPAGPRAWP